MVDYEHKHLSQNNMHTVIVAHSQHWQWEGRKQHVQYTVVQFKSLWLDTFYKATMNPWIICEYTTHKLVPPRTDPCNHYTPPSMINRLSYTKNTVVWSTHLSERMHTRQPSAIFSLFLSCCVWQRHSCVKKTKNKTNKKTTNKQKFLWSL